MQQDYSALVSRYGHQSPPYLKLGFMALNNVLILLLLASPSFRVLVSFIPAHS